MIASLDNPEYPNWPTYLGVALVLIAMVVPIVLFAPHSQRRHKHAHDGIVLCAERTHSLMRAQGANTWRFYSC